MARNLQSKLAPTDTIRVYDINKAAAEGLVEEMKTQQAGGAAAHVARNAGDAAREAVCAISLSPRPPLLSIPGFYDEFVSSMTF
jgi:3-hydroxyisobutyrate dehydrogenase